ncbi:hypothetical protein ART_0686 [Arthrobacter sp. PAMC 25486]|uniref:alpha/beta hydrolase n=1 Tax=Arthrobacter sp. PAMC 25486 TaxID=1494608 RepID=UPI000535F350|nr:alpha/beta-hydrolase family protein [Arthrobacter sp. PAMC 25486]AIY00285.1 hypothetical protein ART_0686 [Arthrobacter sp. PAMC 25486]
MNTVRPASIVGLLAGVSAVALALTPSLVPRPALFQGFLAGVSFALAYVAAAGLYRGVAAFLVRRRMDSCPGKRRVPETQGVPGKRRVPVTLHLPRWLWQVVGAAGLLYVTLVGVLAVRWQNDVRAHVDMPPVDGLDVGMFFAVAILLAGIVFGLRGGLRRLAVLGRHGARRAGLPPGLVTPTGWLAGLLAATLGLGIVVSAALWGTDGVYAARNETTPAGIVEPAEDHRSAGAGSAVEWDKLGMQGRAFVGGGPGAATIENVTGHPALEPVRIYVGSAQEESMAARAALAVAELKRTGGFDRGTLMIATPTGSGWLERQAVDSLEYLHGGDTAIVSMQYSYQPSWVSFLFHQDLPRDSGQALYNAVKAEWDSMPATERPALLVYGLSLGASGMQSAFSGIDDLASSIDGAVFSGAPNNSQPWGALQAQRDPGSPVWQPVFDGGRNVRWLSNTGDFDKLQGPWEPARVAYLQHGTDAVTWLTPRLIWEKPEWLAGTKSTGGRAPDVSDAMRWIPLVTYLQVAFDMFMGEAVPASHGHNFGDVAVEAWNGVAPSRLDPSAVDRIQDVIAAYPYEESLNN